MPLKILRIKIIISNQEKQEKVDQVRKNNRNLATPYPTQATPYLNQVPHLAGEK